jgi:hypothetical protein
MRKCKKLKTEYENVRHISGAHSDELAIIAKTKPISPRGT